MKLYKTVVDQLLQKVLFEMNKQSMYDQKINAKTMNFKS